MMGAGLRRAGVYVVAAVLVVVAGLFAARLARPADPHASVRVEGVSPGAAGGTAETRAVQWNSAHGRGVVGVLESDGVVRRYYMEDKGNGGTRVWGGTEVEPGSENNG